MPKYTAGIDTTGYSKKERQAVAREIAAMKRAEAAARRKIRRRIRITSIVAAIVVVLVIVSLVIYGKYQDGLKGPTNMLSDGMLLTSDSTTVSPTLTAALGAGAKPVATNYETYKSTGYTVIYVDFGNPASQKFWATNPSFSSELLTGEVAVELHPIAASGDFAHRATQAVACVAAYQSDKFLDSMNAIFTAASASGFSGLDTAGIQKLLGTAGVTTATALQCIKDGNYSDWVTQATARALASIPNAGVANAATLPVIAIDQKPYTGAVDDAAALNAFVTAQLGANSANTQ